MCTHSSGHACMPAGSCIQRCSFVLGGWGGNRTLTFCFCKPPTFLLASARVEAIRAQTVQHRGVGRGDEKTCKGNLLLLTKLHQRTRLSSNRRFSALHQAGCAHKFNHRGGNSPWKPRCATTWSTKSVCPHLLPWL